MTFAGAARIDITPAGSVWMDGMIRSRPSEGVHDRLYARAVVLSSAPALDAAFALVSVEVCVLDAETTRTARERAQARTGIPAERIVIAATHTHSGPAALGIFTPRETGYVQDLVRRLPELIAEAAERLEPVAIGSASGRESTISHYRRLLADDGHVVMNWEPFPPERIVCALGAADDEVGVVKIGPVGDPSATLAVLFIHAGHPNILSGDNYLLSADYPGRAAALVEAELGGTALFFNGAEGSVDIDGLRHRDWDGLERAGRSLAACVTETARRAVPSADVDVRGQASRAHLPGRAITDEEWRWAEEVLARTGGTVQTMADGIGDDYKALFLRMLRERGLRELPIEQTCLALGDCALLSFPGELYTEIGRQIKERSPFARTFIIGLANGYVGYVPTRKAIEEGGYAEDTRWVDAAAEDASVEASLDLLSKVHAASEKEGVPT